MMDLPINTFKRALLAKRQQFGLWASLGNTFSTEAVAGAGFDWLLLDMEHSPNDMDSVLAQLQTLAAYPAHPVVRPVWNDPLLVKKLLDLGAQTLLMPYVQSADEAAAAVRSMRYPPRGVRGVSTVTRATRFGRVPDYMHRCEDELCLLVQVETPAALQQIEAIAAVEGVDGIFIGPADLSTSMGHAGKPAHPEVIAAIEDAIVRIRRADKAAGILTTDTALARRFIEWGTTFTAIGVDAALLARAADRLRSEFG
jgi:4-hydroxy-2-oxoheptanedioate aldolase